jgi:uncharacterized membrane protein YhaH (DUF805 family)
VSGVPPVGSVVDGEALVQVLWVSLAAGIGVTASYATAILGATRAIDLSRSGRSGEAAIFALLAVVAVVVVVAAVVFSIIVMTHK